MATARSTAFNDSYFDLVLSFPLRPIRTRSAYEQGKQVFRTLAAKRGSSVRDYKTVLASLLAEYEKNANLLGSSNVTAADLVRHLLEDREMSVNALAKELNLAQSSVSEMLHGRREWSKSAIVKISKFFGLQPGIFLQ